MADRLANLQATQTQLQAEGKDTTRLNEVISNEQQKTSTLGALPIPAPLSTSSAPTPLPPKPPEKLIGTAVSTYGSYSPTTGVETTTRKVGGDTTTTSQQKTQPTGEVTGMDLQKAKDQEQVDLSQVDALKKSSLTAEVDARDTLTQLADDTYARQQQVFDSAQKIYDQNLTAVNNLISQSSDVQRRDAELLYQASKFEMEEAKKRMEKAYQDQLTEQRLNNLSRQMKKESTVAALGGFGSLWAMKEIESTTLENDRLVNDIYFERDAADRDTSFKITQLNDAYQNDLYQIEVNKQEKITQAYSEYLSYVQGVTEDRSNSATQRQELITNATNDYKKNVAEINQNAFDTRYEVSQTARTYADGLKEQIRTQTTQKKTEAKENLATAVELLTTSPQELLSTDIKKLAELESAAGMPVGMTARAVNAIKEELRKGNVTLETFSDGEDVVYVSVDRSDPNNPVIKEVARLDGLGSLSSSIALENAKDGTGTTYSNPTSVFSGGVIPSEPPITAKVGEKDVTAQPVFMTALQKADADFYAATGQHITINESHRSADRQAALYDELSGKGARVAEPGSSFHEKGLAIDVQNWEEAAPYLQKYGITNGLQGDMGHFSMGELSSPTSEASSIAQSIMNGTSTQTLKDVSIKDNLRASVDAELSKLKEPILARMNERLDQGLPPDAQDVMSIMRASAAGKPVSEAVATKLGKIGIVADQVGQLNNVLNSGSSSFTGQDGAKVDISPITGFIKSKNPWSNQGQIAKAINQSTIANLARGVYGEVGVLTDHDIELYNKTLPNLSQPEDIRKSITALTLRTLRNTLESSIMDAAMLGSDLSGYIPRYKMLDNKIKSIEDELAAKIGGSAEQEPDWDNMTDAQLDEWVKSNQ